jgi:hypothetical protein
MSTAASLALVSFLAAAGVPVDLGGLKSTAPASWKEVPVNSPMRVKQFTVPGKEGDAELAVFFFGQGQGGGIQANLDRWKQQFQPPAGQTLEQASKVSSMKVAGTTATMLDIHGTYMFKARPMEPGPGEPRPNHRMLAVVMETPKGNYYLKLVGPAKTVEQNKKEFDAWLKAFK